MPSSIVPQRSFRSGLVDPELSSRDPRYAAGLRTCKNFLPIVHGALVNRAGTTQLGVAASTAPRFKEFIFSDTQALVLEFSALKVRFWTVSGQVLNAGVPYELATPYAAADLARLKFAQSGDVITITHPTYQPRDLTRLSNTNWTLGLVDPTPQAYFGASPHIINPKPGGDLDPAEQWNLATTYAKGYVINRNSVGYISLAAANTGNDPEQAPTWWSPQSWDTNDVYKTGDMAWHTAGYDGTAGSLPGTSNGQLYISLQNVNRGNRPDTAGTYWAVAMDATRPAKDWSIVLTITWRDLTGIVRETLPSAVLSFRLGVYTDRPLTISWGADGLVAFDHTDVEYNVYAGRSGLWGFIGSAPGNTSNGGTFSWDGSAPNFGIQPPKGTNPFDFAPAGKSYPGAVTFHEQRRVFARTDKKPQTFFGSFTADINRFDVNDPPQDSDSYEWKVSSRQLEEIRSLVSMNRLVLFTGQGEFSAQGRDGAGITPNSVMVRRHSSHGSSYLDPIEVENALLFNTAKGNYVRDIFYDYNADAFIGTQLCEYARRLLRGYTITWWAHQRVPYHTVWIGRSDGQLLSITYDRATQTVAWAEHETDGEAIAGACIPNGTEDALMLSVARNGNTCVEIMASRDHIPDQRFACFLDSSLTFDGRNTTADTMNVSGATYAGGDQVNILGSNVASFAATDVGDQLIIDPDGVSPTRITITAYTDPTHAVGTLEQPLPAELQAASTPSWGWARDSFKGLDHLEGKSVTVLADGVVDANGPFTVQAGAVGTLKTPALIAVIGLPYTSDAELLDIAQDAVKPNVKSVLKATVEVVGSRGLSAGEDFDNLHAARLRQVADNFGIPQLVTDQVDVTIKATWNKGGRVCVRQSDPLPLTITAISREVEVGGRG